MVHSAMFFRVLAFVALLISASQVRKKCMERVHCAVCPEANEVFPPRSAMTQLTSSFILALSCRRPLPLGWRSFLRH
jgi:hypothetical protein